MMEASQVADAIVFACMQASHTRILQMTIRHLGAPHHSIEDWRAFAEP
jgi:NADP-dependent 3-hydroxy acid dehydrogenase YdfG